LGSCAHFHVEKELRNATDSKQGVREVPVVGATLNAVMQQARQRAVVLCARQRGKSEQRRQWDLCAAWH
jgi:hypothetical protein